ncbi:ribose-phosphate diphosphokinase [Candidatus Magnetomoraceae bacterium gMMP-15]
MYSEVRVLPPQPFFLRIMFKPYYTNEFFVFAGNAHHQLAEDICSYLRITMGNAKVKTFSDGEIQIEINENVREKDIFVVQPTCCPVNDNLIELILMADALKRSAARQIIAVMPYYGYSRQDKKVAPRVPISAKIIADMLAVAGIHRVITMDLHAGQIQGFFNIPVDNLFSTPVLIKYIRENLKENLVIVSPDAGGVERARAFAKHLKADLAIIDKRRDAPNEAKAMNVIGKVEGKIAIILDDMIDTAGTMVEAVEALLTRKAVEIHACCTHPVLSGPAISRIKESRIKSVVVTDTIPLSKDAEDCGKIKVLSIAELVGEAIIRSHRGDSLSSLFI